MTATFHHQSPILPSGLTRRQEDILAFILTRLDNGSCPTIREIGEEFGISSPNGVMCHLRAFRQKGYLRHDPKSSRNHVVLKVPDSLVHLHPPSRERALRDFALRLIGRMPQDEQAALADRLRAISAPDQPKE